MKRLVRILAVAMIASGTASALPASATTGTWTKITAPKGPGQSIYQNYLSGTTPTMVVTGQASPDVANVNIFCFIQADQKVTSSTALNPSPIPVSSGNFSAAGITTPSTATGCILRAVPDTYTGMSGTTNAGYVGAFTGPTFFFGVHTNTFSSGTKKSAYQTISAHPAALDELSSPDNAGVILGLPNDNFAKVTSGAAAGEANLALFSGNLSTGSSTHSEIRIDGHNAYLPNTLAGIAVDLSTVPAATISTSRSASTGEWTIKESYPLRSCAGDPAGYPQGSATCTPVATGVTLQRSVVTSHGGAVTTVRDRFVSVDHAAHTAKIEYFNLIAGGTSGNPGIRLPGQTSFHVLTAGTTVTSLPVGPHTLFLSSDIHGTDGEPNHSDTGLTYSGKPTLFEASTQSFGLQYTRAIPKNGFAGFAFGLENGFSMKTITPWAAALQKALTPHLALTAPAKTTSDNTPTIKGKVANATNGFPGTVKITVGAKSKTVTVNKSTGAFAVTWTNLANGKHTAKAKATDPSGLVLTASRTFTCT